MVGSPMHLDRSHIRNFSPGYRLRLAGPAILCWFAMAAAVSVGSADEPPTPSGPVEWSTLFNGKDLKGWEIVTDGEFNKAGRVAAEDGSLVLEKGKAATGVRWTKDFPKSNYEVAFDAQRVKGGDFFCGLTFPVKDESLTLILGGWSGWVVGLSCIDGRYAVDNETCGVVEFENDQWYQVRLRVEASLIRVWVDDREVINFEPQGRKLTASGEMKPCQPIGIATWNTTGAIRKLRFRRL